MNAHPGDLAPAAIRTTCPYCGVGCGVLAIPDGQGGLAIAGDPDHPSNFGRLCSKGAALGETVGLDGRLLYPMIRGERASWDRALDHVVGGLGRVLAEHGPDAVAFYLSGQLLTEDYYVANKLMKGFIGSSHVDTNSRLCMSSSVAGHKRAFGSDTVPGCYEDLDEADLLVLVGSNTSWCHPILYRRMQDNRAARGAKIVVIDPRRTGTGEEADLFLGLAPGSDSVLFAGLLVDLARGATSREYVARSTSGYDEVVARAREIAPDLATVAAKTGLDPADVATFYDLFARTERVVTCYSQGVNQSAQGTDKVNAIINCHLATGRIGRPGMGPFSLTGQPNAMGGREVGGLANMLAAHMGFGLDEVDLVRRFWNAPNIAAGEGLKAVAMFDAIEAGRIKALWIMATNPLVSMPDADRVRRALAKLDLLVVSDNVLAADTVKGGAHVLLPAAAWGEKDGTVTNSERRISRQRPALPLPGEVRQDWWIVSAVAARMGFGHAFAYRSPADVFREHARLTAYENEAGGRGLNLSGLMAMTDADYAAMPPVQWPVRPGQGGTARVFGDGVYHAPGGRARFVAPAEPALPAALSDAFPLRLNTGRVRDHWHTMTRTGKSARLGSHRAVPYVEVHPADAARHGLADGALARVSSATGSGVFEVQVAQGQRPGSIFVPIHWTRETSSDGVVGPLVHGFVDPVSGQPDAKATPVAIASEPARLRGFVLSREAVTLPAGTWWARVAVDGGTGTLFATTACAPDVAGWAPDLFDGAELAEYADASADIYRCAAFDRESFVGALFVGPAEARPQWEAVKALFASPSTEELDRRLALSGQGGGVSSGPLVCACFGVGLAAIRAAIAPGGATSPEAIGAALRAGTNCGSCVPELRRIIAHELAPAVG